MFQLILLKQANHIFTLVTLLQQHINNENTLPIHKPNFPAPYQYFITGNLAILLLKQSILTHFTTHTLNKQTSPSTIRTSPRTLTMGVHTRGVQLLSKLASLDQD